VDAKFEELGFPYDVLWLDIEHTDGKRYFTWDARLFPAPAAMQARLAARGHKMVTIIDPHIKKDDGYAVHAAAKAAGHYVRAAGGGEYDGWCWPGSSGYLDFTSPAVRAWWAGLFSLASYAGSTLSLFTWNDMNEPSVFNGPEVSMHKDALSLAGVEHREWHNLYGFYQQAATAAGLTARSPGANARPFVLSRAFFAGSQRHGAIWTGDNAAKWEHLAAAAPMLLTIGAAGLAFAGADVGGFFGNPEPELMRRWYQAGAFQPFFRAHAHIDTARREPWLFGDDVLAALRATVRERYTYLPLWYTLFAAAAADGAPPMRPTWFEFPDEPAAFALDDQWLVGDALLVKPATRAGVTELPVLLPGAAAGALWYDARTYARRAAAPAPVVVPAPLDAMPVFQRGGAIVPRLMRPRRASAMMAADPYTLVVTLDARATAAGTLYLDDGASLDYAKKNAFRLRNFTYAPVASPGAAAGAPQQHALRATAGGGGKAWAPANTVERIIIAGAGRAPTAAAAADADEPLRPLAFDYDAAADVITLRKPDVKVAFAWVVTITF
jgi:alpha 1,3-glucosidase